MKSLSRIGRFERTRINSADNIQYVIPLKAIEITNNVLLGYSRIDPPNEGLVYWGGTRNGNANRITMVIAPYIESGPARISTSNRSNFQVVRTLNRHGVVQIAQVHSHPPYCGVDHSDGDSEWAAFRAEGLLSIVVPEYCKNRMLPLTSCGIHRYSNQEFVRLSDSYIGKHFMLTEDDSVQLIDFRHEQF